MQRSVFSGPRGSTWTIDEPTSVRERRRGARGRRWTSPYEGMFFERCTSIHTFGMREPISVASLDARRRVLSVTIVAPRRVLLPRPRVRHILECRADADVRPGDRFTKAGPADRG